MTHNARLLTPIFALAAIIVVSWPMRTLAHEPTQLLIATSDQVLTFEFSAANKKKQQRVTGSGGSQKTAKVNTGGRKGKVYMDNMGPNTALSTQNAPTDASAKNKKNISEKEWIKKHGALMDRNLKKNPRQDPSQLSDLITEELNKKYIRVDEPKVQAAPEKVLTDEERRAYGEAARKDHEETERLKAEQKAKENFNPNAEIYRPSGITAEEHGELNQRSLPGKPNGTE